MREFPEANWPEWEIERKIGSGSFGSVYSIIRTENDYLYRDALKVVNIPRSSDELSSLEAGGMDESSISEYCRSRALKVYNEINTLIRLGGVTNIVNYKDHKMVTLDDGISYRIFIRMELLTSLRDYQKRNGMDLLTVQKMGIDLSRALEYCEGQRIIHRDIKPDNIFVSGNGDFKLGDFGTARYMQSMNYGTIAGTFNYMAPEVYSQKPYDLRADIYSLGMVLYQFLNRGRLPFLPQEKQILDADDVEEAFRRRIQGERVPEIAGIDPALSAAVTHAIEYEPSRRFASAKEFRAALENPSAWYAGTGQSAAPYSARPAGDETILLSPGLMPGGISEMSNSTGFYCKVCGERLNPGASFCRRCGTRTAALQVPQEAREPRKKKHLAAILAAAAGAAVLLGLLIGFIIYFAESRPGEGKKTAQSGSSRFEENTSQDRDALETESEREETSDNSEGSGPKTEDSDSEGSPAAADEDTEGDSAEETPSETEDAGTAAPETTASETEPVLPPMPQVNDYVLFGSFEQDNNTGNGGEAVRWRVIDVDAEANRVLLITEYSLENLQFDSESESQSWENSSLRRWLNNSFYNDAFSPGEKAVIEPVSCENTYSFPGVDSALSDRVFCLSKEDVEKLMPVLSDRIAKNSDFAQEQMKKKMLPSWFYPNSAAEVEATVAGWEAQYGVHCSWWWLRDPAGCGVTAAGEIRADQVDRRDLNSVRPAVWISWERVQQGISEGTAQEFDISGFGTPETKTESVSLFSLPGANLAGGTELLGECRDIYGTVYRSVLAGTVSEFDNTVEYVIDGQYTVFSGTVIRDSSADTARLSNPNRTDIILSVYGDGVLLYQSVSVNLASGVLQDFSVSVQGVKTLRIVINGKNFIRLCNAKLS